MTTKPKILVVYVSYGGNSRLMAENAFRNLRQYGDVDLYNVENFDIEELNNYTHICMSTLTWGKGEVPSEWVETGFLKKLHEIDKKRVIVIGTGDDVYGQGFNRATEVLANYASEKHTVIGKLKMLLKPKTESDFVRIKKITDALINKVIE